MNKRIQKERRAKKTRCKIRSLGERNRLTVHRSAMHIYAQVMTSDGSRTLVAASTLDKKLRESLKVTGNVEAAKQVGKLIAERALAAGIKEVAFDRAGFQFHGRVKALADAAREDGLIF